MLNSVLAIVFNNNTVHMKDDDYYHEILSVGDNESTKFADSTLMVYRLLLSSMVYIVQI